MVTKRNIITTSNIYCIENVQSVIEYDIVFVPSGKACRPSNPKLAEVSNATPRCYSEAANGLGATKCNRILIVKGNLVTIKNINTQEVVRGVIKSNKVIDPNPSREGCRTTSNVNCTNICNTATRCYSKRAISRNTIKGNRICVTKRNIITTSDTDCTKVVLGVIESDHVTGPSPSGKGCCTSKFNYAIANNGSVRGYSKVAIISRNVPKPGHATGIGIDSDIPPTSINIYICPIKLAVRSRGKYTPIKINIGNTISC